MTIVTKLLDHLAAHVDRGLRLVAAEGLPDTGTGAVGLRRKVQTSCLFDDMLELASGSIESAKVDVLNVETLVVESGVLNRSELTRSADRYFYRVAIAARLFLDGERHFSV